MPASPRNPRAGVHALTHDPATLFQPPETVGPYRVRRALASGTLGPRLLVDDPRGRVAVLKLITDAGTHAPALAERLDQMRRALPAHAGVQAVLDVGHDGDDVYLLSPLMDLPTVEARLRGGRQTLEATVSWLLPIADAVQAAHGPDPMHGPTHGLVHGAIHPRDVLVGAGGGVLTGLGIAPALEALGLQAPVRVPFTAPERASGGAWDARADQYSLAMLALDALSGRRLIAGTIPAFDRWTLAETPAEDARLHEVFVRSLHPDPAERFSSVAAWIDALAGALGPASGELSRFAREGVILTTGAAASSEEPPPEIQVQSLEDPEGVALSLFPEEDGTALEPPASSLQRPASSGETLAAASAPGPEAEQEWLVAAVPGPVLDPAEVTAPEPDSPPLVLPPLVLPPLVLPPVEPPAERAAPREAGAWTLDDRDARSEPAVLSSWTEADDEQGSRRGPWLVIAALLVITALGYGTWRSLQDRTGVSLEQVQSPGAGEGGGIAQDTGSGSDSGPDRGTDAGAPPPGTTEDIDPPQTPTPSSPAAGARARPPSGGTAVVPQEPRSSAAPDTPARANATPAVPALGRALIRSSPSGQVSINGRVRGETPVVLRDLAFGSYVVTIARPGFETVEQEFSLLASQPVASVSVALPRGGAPATSVPPPVPAPGPPPSRVPASQGGAIDPPAPAPPSRDRSPSGPPATVAPAVAPPQRTAPGRPASTGGLHVVSTPARARLFIDGQYYGTTPAAIPGLTIGAHAVRVEATGFRTWESRADVTPGARVRVQATLQREPQ